jgi:hypothetical protein
MHLDTAATSRGAAPGPDFYFAWGCSSVPRSFALSRPEANDVAAYIETFAR